MSKVFPLHGYAVRRKHSPNEVKSILRSRFDSQHVNTICDFCDLMLEGLDRDGLRNFENSQDSSIKRSPNMHISLARLMESGCYVETNLVHRPILQSLVSRCSRVSDGSFVHDHGSLVISRFQDIFFKTEGDHVKEAIRRLIDSRIPVFAIEDDDFVSLINKIQINPDKIELYEEIIDLSYGYYKNVEIFLS